jgi:hypothetical protein
VRSCHGAPDTTGSVAVTELDVSETVPDEVWESIVGSGAANNVILLVATVLDSTELLVVSSDVRLGACDVVREAESYDECRFVSEPTSEGGGIVLVAGDEGTHSEGANGIDPFPLGNSGSLASSGEVGVGPVPFTGTGGSGEAMCVVWFVGRGVYSREDKGNIRSGWGVSGIVAALARGPEGL